MCFTLCPLLHAVQQPLNCCPSCAAIKAAHANLHCSATDPTVLLTLPPYPQADEAEGWQDCLAWLAECGAVVTDADTPAEATLDCKASTGQLKMPEEKEKVAHGDENLRVEDFLKGFA